MDEVKDKWCLQLPQQQRQFVVKRFSSLSDWIRPAFARRVHRDASS
jgi:hypothetical protein